METEKRLYRSRDALIGGVCSGVAEYFSIDPLVARILAVVLTVSTAGLLGVAYIALWVVLPLAPENAEPFDVEPQSVKSDTYGRVDFEAARGKSDATSAASVGGASQSVPFDSFVGSGHVPPEPPASASAWSSAAYGSDSAKWQGASWRAPGWQGVSRPQTGAAEDAAQAGAAGAVPQQPWSQPHTPPTDVQRACAQQPGQATPQQPAGWSAAQPGQAVPQQPAGWPATQPGQPSAQQQPNWAAAWQPEQPAVSWNTSSDVHQTENRRSSGVKVAIWLGSLCLFFGIVALLANHVHGISWWQFWPLIFSIIGIMQMVVPGEPGHRATQFVNGLILFSLGSVLLFLSLGIFGWETLRLMFGNLWPLLLMMTGFFMIGAALRSPWWTLAAGLCFVAFCVVGILWFAVPGPTDVIVLTLPFGREYAFSMGML